MAIEKCVEMKFMMRIDGEDVAMANADLFRLYELLRATIDIHSHRGFHSIGSSCSNMALPESKF